MQPTNRPSKQQSRCMYCGSTTRGKGCRYGPHGVHFFPDDPRKCAYCGSTDYGKGCHVNPISNVHVHGTNYTILFKDNLQSFLDNKVFLNELKKDFKEFNAYKLGIIDERGNKIKTPVTENEQAAYSPMIKTIIRVKKYLGAKAELLDSTNLLEKESLSENIENYKKLLVYKDQIESLVNEIYKVLDTATNEGSSLDDLIALIKA